MKFADTCVVLCAGRGTRMGGDIPKVLQSVAGRPVVSWVIDFWKNQGVTEFIFVVGYKAYLVTEYIASNGVNGSKVAVQYEQKGIAHAVATVKNMVPEKFIVALGDCLQVGEFIYPDNFEQGYAVWRTDYGKALAQGCAVRTRHGLVTGIDEKPEVTVPGIGTYFFNRNVFNYIQITPTSKLRNEVEISDVIGNMVAHGETLHAVEFYGDFINVTYPRDIKKAEKLIEGGMVVNERFK